MDPTQLIFAAYEMHGDTLGIDFPNGVDGYPRGRRVPYFFIEAPSKKSAQKVEKYRHLKVLPNKFIDYINGKYYDTLNEWAASIPNIHDAEIRFGFQRWDGKNNSVELANVISRLQPQRVEIPTMPQQLPQDNDECHELFKLANQLATKMHIDGLTFENDVIVRSWMPAMHYMRE